MPDLFLGMMSGTSLDGVDAVLVDFSPPGGLQRVLSHAHEAFDTPLRQELLSLNSSGPDELHRSALATHALGRVHVRAARRVLASAEVSFTDVRAIGVHGQTVRHQPDLPQEELGYTVQLDPSAMVAEALGIDTVSDFRTQDVAAGGQGAPLVPAYHRALFAQPGVNVAVVNIGGMANVSRLQSDGGVSGFDTGPGNVLMDAWMQDHMGLDCDVGGRLAAAGTVDADLLARLLAEPYFAVDPPKSTGRELFSRAWLQTRASGRLLEVADADLMATLCELTARTISDALASFPASQVWVCGGGAFNAELMRRLQMNLARASVRSTSDAGLPPDQVEACAFAWLAREHLEGRTANVPAVTGARGARVLGAHRVATPGR